MWGRGAETPGLYLLSSCNEHCRERRRGDKCGKYSCPGTFPFQSHCFHPKEMCRSFFCDQRRVRGVGGIVETTIIFFYVFLTNLSLLSTLGFPYMAYRDFWVLRLSRHFIMIISPNVKSLWSHEEFYGSQNRNDIQWRHCAVSNSRCISSESSTWLLHTNWFMRTTCKA